MSDIDANVCGVCGNRAVMFFVHGYRCREHAFVVEPSDAVIAERTVIVVPGLGRALHRKEAKK